MIDISWCHNNELILDKEFDLKIKNKTKKKLTNGKLYSVYGISVLSLFNKNNDVIQSPSILDISQNTELLNEPIANNGMIENLQIIADFCKTLGEFIQNVIWIVRNPIESLVILLEYLLPLMIFLASIVPIIGLISMMFGSKKFLKWNTNDMIVNPLIVLFIYLMVLGMLKMLTH